MSFGTKYSEIYDALYQDKDYEAEALYVRDLIDRNLGIAGPSILEIGIGSGKHAEHLTRLIDPHSYLGIEPSRSMAQIARDRGFEVIENDAQRGMVLVPTDSQHVILALFHVVSYLTDSEDLSDFFRHVARALRSGGIAIFDVWHAPAVLSEGMSVRVKRVKLSDGREIVRVADPKLNFEKSLGLVNYDVFVETEESGRYERFSESHCLRFFDSPELIQLIENSGLKLEESHEFLTGTSPSTATWGVCYVARAGVAE